MSTNVIMEIGVILDGAGGIGNGKLRLTGDRLLFERRKVLGGRGGVTTLALSSIQSVDVSGVMEKKLRVTAGSQEYVFREGLTDNGGGKLRKMAAAIQDAMTAPHEGTSSHMPGIEVSPSVPASSIAEEVGKLAALHKAGALTDDEFRAAKARAIGG